MSARRPNSKASSSQGDALEVSICPLLLSRRREQLPLFSLKLRVRDNAAFKQIIEL